MNAPNGSNTKRKITLFEIFTRSLSELNTMRKTTIAFFYSYGCQTLTDSEGTQAVGLPPNQKGHLIRSVLRFPRDGQTQGWGGTRSRSSRRRAVAAVTLNKSIVISWVLHGDWIQCSTSLIAWRSFVFQGGQLH